MVSKALFSSAKSEWETPLSLIVQLGMEFVFSLDVCADADNAKAPMFYTVEQDGLKQDWHRDAGDGVCWCNPPYGRTVGLWTEKAYKESLKGATVVMLLPVRSCTKWFHEWVIGKAEIRFIRGRLKFGGSKCGAPFPSMLVIYRPFKSYKLS